MSLTKSSTLIYGLLIASLFAFPILPYAALSILLGSTLLFSLLHFKSSKISTQYFVLQIAFYFVLLLSVIYTSNQKEAWNEIARTIPLVVIPLIIFFSSKNLIYRFQRSFKLIFITSTFILFLIIFDFLVEGMAKDRIPSLLEYSIIEKIKYLWTYPYEFVREKSLNQLGATWFMNHKTIISIYFLSASLFIVQLLFDRQIFLPIKLILVPLLVVFVISTIYTQSLVNAFLVVLLPIYLISKFKSNTFKMLISLLMIGFGIFLFNTLNIKEAYSNRNTEAAIQLLKSTVKGEVSSDADPRLYINYCNVNLIKEAPFLGYGVGDVQDQLNNCYATNQFEPKVHKERIFNSHNYFAHIFLASGMIGFIVLVFTFLVYLFKGWQNKDKLFFFFTLLIGCNLLFDNVILRYQGAVFYGLMISFLFILLKRNKE